MNKKTFSRIALIAVPLALLILIGIWFLTIRGQRNLGNLDDEAFREYANEVVGVDEVINEYLLSGQIWARFRTNEELDAHDHEVMRYISEDASEAERHRWFYEEALVQQIITAKADLPEDIGPGGKLETAHFEAMRACAEDRGWVPEVLDQRLWENPARAEALGGPRREEYFDLRHECAQWAESYPTLGDAERERLLNLRYEHHWQAIKQFIVDHPEAVVERLP